MLNHIALHYRDERPEEVKVQIKMMSHKRTTFERQITEAGLIRRNGGPRLMNSKKVYNRCYISEIVVKKSQNDDTKTPKIEAEETALEVLQKMRPIWKKRKMRGAEKLEISEESFKTNQIRPDFDSNGSIRGEHFGDIYQNFELTPLGLNGRYSGTKLDPILGVMNPLDSNRSNRGENLGFDPN